MNIAIINTLAKTGSTGKIAYGFQKYLKQNGHNAYIFYGRHDELVTPEETDIIRVGNDIDLCLHGIGARLTGMQGKYSAAATARMLRQFDRLEIQAVCMFNLHGYYLNAPMLFRYLGQRKLPCEYVMLDEYPFLGKCAYSFSCEKFKTRCRDCPRKHEHPKSLFFDSSTRMFQLKKEMYDLAPQCLFVGVAYTVGRAKESAIMKGRRFAVADEAVDLQNVYYPRQTDQLREQLHIPKENRVIVTVTPYPNERKGGKFFLAAAALMEDEKDLTFVHVGFTADTSICPSNYRAVGYVADQELLAEYYSLGDLFVHTSLAETIPASIIEALSCGTPILGFHASGIPYTCDDEHGTFVEPENLEELMRVIGQTPRKTPERIASCRAYAQSRYDARDYNRKLLAFLCREEGDV